MDKGIIDLGKIPLNYFMRDWINFGYIGSTNLFRYNWYNRNEHVFDAVQQGPFGHAASALSNTFKSGGYEYKHFIFDHRLYSELRCQAGRSQNSIVILQQQSSCSAKRRIRAVDSVCISETPSEDRSGIGRFMHGELVRLQSDAWIQHHRKGCYLLNRDSATKHKCIDYCKEEGILPTERNLVHALYHFTQLDIDRGDTGEGYSKECSEVLFNLKPKPLSVLDESGRVKSHKQQLEACGEKISEVLDDPEFESKLLVRPSNSLGTDVKARVPEVLKLHENVVKVSNHVEAHKQLVLSSPLKSGIHNSHYDLYVHGIHSHMGRGIVLVDKMRTEYHRSKSLPHDVEHQLH